MEKKWNTGEDWPIQGIFFSGGRVSMDEEKVIAMLSWPTTRNLKEL